MNTGTMEYCRFHNVLKDAYFIEESFSERASLDDLSEEELAAAQKALRVLKKVVENWEHLA